MIATSSTFSVRALVNRALSRAREASSAPRAEASPPSAMRAPRGVIDAGRAFAVLPIGTEPQGATAMSVNSDTDDAAAGSSSELSAGAAGAPPGHTSSGAAAAQEQTTLSPEELAALRDASLKRISDRAIALGLSQQSYDGLMMRAAAEINHRTTMDLIGADPKLPAGYAFPTPEVDAYLDLVEEAVRRWDAKNGAETDPVLTRRETYASINAIS